MGIPVPYWIGLSRARGYFSLINITGSNFHQALHSSLLVGSACRNLDLHPVVHAEGQNAHEAFPIGVNTICGNGNLASKINGTPDKTSRRLLVESIRSGYSYTII